MRGDKNHNFGKKMSEEQKKKISYTMTNRSINYELSEKQLKALKAGHLEHKKKVGKYDNNNNLLEEYKCITDASNITKISRQGISKVCNNIKAYNTAGGFIWKFI